MATPDGFWWDERYYSVEASESFSDCFSFGDWNSAQEAPAEEPVLSLRFAELWVLEFYPEGLAAAYDGYAAGGTRSEAYYLVPEKITEQVFQYLSEHGSPQEYGDGMISSSTFNH